jgi:serine/threonine-protein kinase
VVVERGARAAHHVELGTARGDSGIRVSAEGTDLRVFLDGRDVGAPPVDLKGLEPGVHVVRVVGPGDTYQAYEETIELRSGEVRTLGPVRLKVQKGTLTLEAGPGAEGAQVWVDNQPISELPMVLDLAADKVHEVRASRPGHASFSEQVEFDGEGRRTVRVELTPDVGGGAVRAVRSVRKPAQKLASPAPPAAKTGAFLNFNSIPVSSVIVDGRPVGFTPITNIAVEPGSHTIVFVHPELGRKITSATVEAGGRKTVAVRFQ